MTVQINAEYDDEAGVWVATSDDVPGLVAEHSVISKLWDMVTDLVPILLVENGLMSKTAARQIPVHFSAQAERDVLVTV